MLSAYPFLPSISLPSSLSPTASSPPHGSAQAAATKYHRLDGQWTTEICFSQLRRLESPRSRYWQGKLHSETSPLGARVTCSLCVYNLFSGLSVWGRGRGKEKGDEERQEMGNLSSVSSSFYKKDTNQSSHRASVVTNTWPGSLRMQVWSLASLSGLSIWHCSGCGVGWQLSLQLDP